MLVAVAYGFMLPAIAVLHVRHAAVRQSGAILGTIAGTAVVAVGLAASANVDVRPASLFVLGIWWWTIGKMWTQTGVLPRPFGYLTAALGVVSFALVPLDAFARPSFSAVHPLLGLWLLALAFTFARQRAA